ncbi:MAG: GAF domain-containing protein [Bacteroidales bacterium]|nr:GAF domain-containing protein [Bacteroidales bacterium]
MAEELVLTTGATKEEKYRQLLPQLGALTDGEPDITANMANLAAALHQAFGWWWVGFYRVQDDELVLGPFQGPIACTRIRKGKGVCGTAWAEKRSLLVPDVNAFPGHIACSSLSVAEIVVPVYDAQGEVAAVLDVDSERYDILDETDVHYLEQVAGLLYR